MSPPPVAIPAATPSLCCATLLPSPKGKHPLEQIDLPDPDEIVPELNLTIIGALIHSRMNNRRDSASPLTFDRCNG